MHDLDVKNAIIFCNRKRDVAILLKSLHEARLQRRRDARRHGSEEPHGDARCLPRRRDQLLAASDVAARGLDIPDVSTSSTSICPGKPTTTCTASAALAAQGAKARRIRPS
jgi:superfamily II DNA/RNA helicase